MEINEKKGKKGIVQMLHENVWLQFCFCILSVLVLVVAYLPWKILVKEERTTDKILKCAVTEDNNVLSDITEVQESGNKLILSGWVIRLNTEKQEVNVVLSPVDAETEQDIILWTKQKDNPVVLNYLNYLKQEQTAGSGFLAEVKTEKLVEDVCYEVLLYVKAEQKTQYTAKVSSKKYLYNGEIFPYNPLEFSAPEFADEQMKTVVEKGNLIGYTMEHGAWVYQYEGSLYWILDKNVGQNAEEDLYIFFHLQTPHTDLLPDWRKEYGFDNQDFSISAYELKLEEEYYRVAVRNLQTEYSITYITTGHYTGEKNLWTIRGRVEIGK